MRHQIELQRLEVWANKQEILYASCTKSKKKLYVLMSNKFKVYSKGKLVYETIIASAAVEAYNEL